jgi:hypothetical protein
MRHYVLTLLNHEYQNVDVLPARYRIEGDKFVAWALIIFGTVFGAESIFIAISSAADGTLANSVLGTKHIVFGPMGVLFLIWGVNQFFIKGELVIDRLSVTCKYKRLFGKREWSEPLSNYRIRKKVGSKKDTGTGSELLYCIWLWHDKRSRRVKIYQASTSTEWEEKADFYARLFRLQRTNHEKGK